MINRLNIPHTQRKVPKRKAGFFQRLPMLTSAKKFPYTVHPFVLLADFIKYLVCVQILRWILEPQTTRASFIPSRLWRYFEEDGFIHRLGIAKQKQIHWQLNPFVSLPQHNDLSHLFTTLVKGPVSSLCIWPIFSHAGTVGLIWLRLHLLKTKEIILIT